MRFGKSRVYAAVLAATGLLGGCAQSVRTIALDDGERFIERAASDAEPAPRRSGEVTPAQFSGDVSAVNTSLADAPLPVPRRVERELVELRDCLLAGWAGEAAAPEVVVSSNLLPGGEAVPDRVTLYLGLLAGEDATAAKTAFVLAHELAHTLLDHYDRVEFLQGQERVTAGLATAGVVASVLAETDVRRQGDQLDVAVADQDAVDSDTRAVLAAFAVGRILLDGVIESSWSREQELQADLLGVDLLVNGGVPRFAAPNALQAVQAFEAQRETRLARFEDIAAYRIEQAVETGELATIVDTAAGVVVEAGRRGLADLYDIVDAPTLDVDARMTALRDYDEHAFVGRDVAAMTVGEPCEVGGLEQALADPRMGRLYDAVFAANGVELALLEGDRATARARVDEALAGELRYHPLARIAAYRFARAENDRRAALAHLRAIRRDADTPISVYTFLAAELLRADQPVEARRVLDEGRRHYPDDPFHPLRLQTAYALDDEAAADAIAQACARSEHYRIRAACARIVDSNAPADAAGAPPDLAKPFGELYDQLEEAVDQLGI